MLTLRNTKRLKLYNSLDTLKILTFWKIIQDKNILLLDFDYYDGKKYTDKDVKLIQSNWDNLYDEYYNLVNDSKTKHKLSKAFKELQTRSKINEIKNYIDFLISLKKGIGYVEEEIILKYEQQVYANLKKVDKRIKPKLFDGIDVNIQYLDKFLSALINTYNRDNENVKKEVEKQISNVYDVVASVESWLERSLPIEEISVTRWLAYEKQVKNKQKASKKNGKR
jgi:hypothetical protein